MKRVGQLAILLKPLCFVCGMVLSGCDNEKKVAEPRVDPIRNVFAIALDHPAVWNESDSKTLVNKIAVGGDRVFTQKKTRSLNSPRG